MATSILLKFVTLKWNISGTIWRIEVGDGSYFCIFHALSFELNFFFDRRFPLRLLFIFATEHTLLCMFLNIWFQILFLGDLDYAAL